MSNEPWKDQNLKNYIKALESKGDPRDQPDAIRVVNQNTQDFETLLLDNVPYGRIKPEDLTQRVFEVHSTYLGNLPAPQPMYWNFGGKAYEIGKAVKVSYEYKFTDYGGQVMSASLFIGYEHIPAWNYRRSPPAKLVQSPSLAFSSFSNEPMQSIANRVAMKIEDYNRFIMQQMPCNSAPQDEPGYFGFLEHDAKPRALKYGLVPANAMFVAGLARDYDADRPFPFTYEDITSDQAKYNRLVHLQFGGEVYRITKMLRIPYTIRKFPQEDAGPEYSIAAGENQGQEPPEPTFVANAAAQKYRDEKYENELTNSMCSLFFCYQGGGIHGP